MEPSLPCREGRGQVPGPLKPDHTERRGERVLMIWGDIPYWTVVDRAAARFIEALCIGKPIVDAIEAIPTKDRSPGIEHDAARIVTSLRRAGVLTGRRLKPPKERIESISVNVTTRCNLRCSFCYNARRPGTAQELSADEMIEALESVRKWTAKGAMIALFGGEPTLEKDKTLALAQWARRRGFSAIMSTNGTLVDTEFAARAAEVGLECQVSVDGPDAASHDAVRGAGTFEQAVAGVRYLVEAGAHTIISMVFHSGNVDGIPDYLRMALELGVKEARFIPIKQVGGGTDYRVPNLAGVIKQVVELLDREPKLGPLLGRDFVSILAQTCHACAARQSCGTGSQTFLLDADGTVYPCINLAQPEMAVGNVKMEPLRRIWVDSDRLGDVRENVRLAARQETCGNCFVRHWCMGGCRGETYEVYGRLDRPSVTCKQNRESIIEMFWQLSRHPQLARPGIKYC